MTNRTKSCGKNIERNIGFCGLFIVVLSNATQDRLRRWQVEDNAAPDKKPYFLME